MPAPRRALIIIDAQQQYASGPLRIQYPAWEGSLERIAQAIDAAQEAGLPIAVVQHSSGRGARAFNPGTPQFELAPGIAERLRPGWKRVVKERSSAFISTDLGPWLREQGVDTIALAGYMTNNCVLATAVDAERWGMSAEVLSDATGAIHLANAAGAVSAQALHESLMVLLQSNWAAVASAREWTDAVRSGRPLRPNGLAASALAGSASACPAAPGCSPHRHASYPPLSSKGSPTT